MEFDSTDKLCPVCMLSARYVIVGSGAYWVHVSNGRPVFNGHDVNTYATDHLVTRDDTAELDIARTTRELHGWYDVDDNDL